MNAPRFNPRFLRFNISTSAKFTLGVTLILGAVMGADRTAFSTSPKSERLSDSQSFSNFSSTPSEPSPSDDQPYGPLKKLAELTKGSMTSMFDSRPIDGPRSAPIQGEARPEIQLVRENEAEFAPASVAGSPGQPTPLPLTLSAAKAGESSLFTFRGLPNSVKLSSGFRFQDSHSQDSWAVSLKDIGGLQLLPDPGYEGVFTVEISLVKKRDGAPEKQSIQVDIRRQRGGSASSVTIGSGQSTAAESAIAPAIAFGPSTQPKIPATEEAAMIERANGFLQSGDVAAARLLYERLARRGSSQGALALARTFDPATLRTLAVVGLKPDLGKAREWYKRAAELGSKEAGNRLATLEAELR
jgi:hypothetical protein